MKITYYDIETGPNLTVDPWDFHAPFRPYTEDGLVIGPKDRISPEDKRAAHLAKFNEAKTEHDEKVLSRLALDPTTAKIECIVLRDGMGEYSLLAGSEEDILSMFWERINMDKQVYFANWTGTSNNANFDLNMLYRRSWAHPDIKVPHVYENRWKDVAKYFLRRADWNKGIRLERAALSMGLTVEKFPTVTGANFAEHFHGNDEALRKEALDYVYQDVRLLSEIHERIRIS